MLSLGRVVERSPLTPPIIHSSPLAIKPIVPPILKAVYDFS